VPNEELVRDGHSFFDDGQPICDKTTLYADIAVHSYPAEVYPEPTCCCHTVMDAGIAADTVNPRYDQAALNADSRIEDIEGSSY